MKLFDDKFNGYIAHNDIVYCFQIIFVNNKILYFTSDNESLTIGQNTYVPNSNLRIMRAYFDDSGCDTIAIGGTYDNDNGVSIYDILTDAQFDIYLTTCHSLEHWYSGICVKFQKNNDKFHIELAPLTYQFNRMLTVNYSKDCRANLGDNKCKIRLEQYTTQYNISSIQINEVVLTQCDQDSGYYNYGTATIMYDNNNKKFIAKIINHSQNTIFLDRPIYEDISDSQCIELTPGCDKKLTTCCKVFDNVVNFRGEPFIPC